MSATASRNEELGPLAALLDDPTVSEFMVNGPQHIFAVRHGRLSQVDALFLDDAQLLRAARALVGDPEVLSEAFPITEFRLPDESRVVMVARPISLTGISIMYRRGAILQMSIDDLLRYESLSPDMALFVQACVRARLSILVAGGTASGKTTVANILLGFIPPEERVITIEQRAELLIERNHLVRLEARPPNREGTGAISMRDLADLALHMRPERLVFGELRGEETWSLIQALNSGHAGSLALIHATDARDALARIELQIGLAEPTMPLAAIRQQIASGLDLIVQVNRLPDGSRRFMSISEVQGYERESVILRDLFVYELTGGTDTNGHLRGRFRATGERPVRGASALARLADDDQLPETLFDPPIDIQPEQSATLDSSDVAALDAQLGETTMLMVLLFRAGYNVMQAFDLLAHELPPPSATVFALALAESQRGTMVFTTMANLTVQVPSVYLRALADTIERQYRDGGNLADLLEPLALSIQQQAGTDPALNPVSAQIRRLVGA
ncbi:MAG: ATPase, T2SS/T4P/T4SS family [Roseiflexaceae bacterium]|nr:ATPase, T2SS/T4P/T4SS family [Roseiflexaceae bacterium]